MKIPSPRTVPLRIRLVSGFAAAMLVVLSAAGAFVYWRVELALDRTLNSDLATQSSELRRALTSHPDPVAALASLPSQASRNQILDSAGHLLAATPGAGTQSLLPAARLRTAQRAPVRYDIGRLLLDRSRRLRVLAFPVSGPGADPLVALTAVRLGQRDEALRELLAQLVVANLTALAIASLVGYRLAQRALAPVERYRARAQEITSGATGVRLDVSEHIDDEVTRLGHTLNQMLAAQEHATIAQRQFLADASHELRTPLTVLTAEVELALRRSRPAKELEETLRNVAQDAARLVRLADQLLDLEQAQLVGSAAEADVDFALDGAAARTRARLADSGRTVETRPAPGLIVPVSAIQLHQVLDNLADNAVTHGAGPIRLTSESVARASQPLARIEVSDSGPGMPPDFVPKAIDRFRRADIARTTPGNGLGLALVHTLVAGAGGEVRMCSAAQHHTYSPARFADVPCMTHDGTTATVLLPATRREQP